MRYHVTRLRVHGRRLRGGEAPQVVVGELTIEVEVSNRPGGLPRRVATVWLLRHGVTGQPPYRHSLCVPLFDVQLVSLDADGVLTLRGIELHGHGEPGRMEVSEHHQVWRCRPLGAAS